MNQKKAKALRKQINHLAEDLQEYGKPLNKRNLVVHAQGEKVVTLHGIFDANGNVVKFPMLWKVLRNDSYSARGIYQASKQGRIRAL